MPAQDRLGGCALAASAHLDTGRAGGLHGRRGRMPCARSDQNNPGSHKQRPGSQTPGSQAESLFQFGKTSNLFGLEVGRRLSEGLPCERTWRGHPGPQKRSRPLCRWRHPGFLECSPAEAMHSQDHPLRPFKQNFGLLDPNYNHQWSSLQASWVCLKMPKRPHRKRNNSATTSPMRSGSWMTACCTSKGPLRFARGSG